VFILCHSWSSIAFLPTMIGAFLSLNPLRYLSAGIAFFILFCRHVSHICEETLGFLKQTKHKAWRDSMLNVFGNCAKAFIPSLKQGLITHMYVLAFFMLPCV
jgi:hypothetical protein